MNNVTNRVLTARLNEEIDDRKSMSISGDTMPLIIVGTDCKRSSLTVRVADSYRELFNEMLDNSDLNYDDLDSLYGEVDDEENYSLNINDYKEALFDGLSRSDRFYYSENNFNEWDKQEENSKNELKKFVEIETVKQTINEYKHDTAYFDGSITQEELFQSLRHNGYGKAETLVIIASLVNSGAKFKENI